MVRIGREHLPRSTEKLITLSGTPDVIRTTIEKICQGLLAAYSVYYESQEKNEPTVKRFQFSYDIGRSTK